MMINKLELLLRAFDELVRDRFYGKYEAVVEDVDDPLEIGRVRVSVPAVLGEGQLSGWAMPCVSAGGRRSGLLYVPEAGDTVWLEFVAGDLARPVYTGALWAAPTSTGDADDLAGAAGPEIPCANEGPASTTRLVLCSKSGHRIVFDDDSGALLIGHGGSSATITIDASGKITIEGGEIALGEGASESVVLGNAFMQMFNQHTHGTGVGPSTPPVVSMTQAQLSTKVKSV